MKIILADDDYLVLKGLNATIQWNLFDGEVVGNFKDGQEVLDFLKHHKADVIISDIRMPNVDGLTLAQYIYEQNLDTHMILLSGHSDFSYAQKAITYQVKEYLLKPITREKLKQLEHTLYNIYESKQKQKISVLHAWDLSLKNSILLALQQNDKSYFDEFFCSSLFFDAMKHSPNCTIGIQLLNYLYTYLLSTHNHNEYLKRSLNKLIDEFYELPSNKQKMDYIITKYFDVLLSSQTRAENISTVALRAQKIVATNYQNPDFNISFLANKMNLSLSYLSTIFKHEFGINLSTYIGNLRLNHAQQLLEETDYAINEVALLCGYEDAKYFSKLFKKKNDLTPSEYRNHFNLLTSQTTSTTHST